MGTPVKRVLDMKYNIWKPLYYNTDREGFAGMWMNVGAAKKGNNIYAVFQEQQASAKRDTYAVKFDGTSWGASIEAAQTNLTDSTQIADDGHGGPCIVRDIAGYLHVFAGCHDNQVAYGKSNNPDDISAWTDCETLVSGTNKADRCTYPVAYMAPDTGRLVLIFRDTITDMTDYNSSHMFSDNNGGTWSDRKDFYHDTHVTYDYGGSNWWSYPVSGPQSYVTKINGEWYIEYNWNCRTLYNSPFRREHQYYARLKFSDLEFYDINGTKQSTNGTFSTGTADTSFRMLSTSGTWCAGNIRTTERGIPLHVFAYDSTSYCSREYANGTWSHWVTITSISPPRTPDTANPVVFEFFGKTYCACDPFAYSVASNSANNEIGLYEYNWNAHTWKRVAPIMTGQGARYWTNSAFLRYSNWCGNDPNEGPLLIWQDVGNVGGGNHGYVAALNSKGALEVVASGTQLYNASSSGVRTSKQDVDYSIVFDGGVYNAINAKTGKIDYTSSNYYTVHQNILNSLPNGCGTIASIKGLEATTEITKYKNKSPTGISTNLISDLFAIDSATTVIVTVAHGLDFVPPVESIAVTLVEGTNVDDWVAVPRIMFVDGTNIYVKVKVSTASSTSGAKARLVLKVDIR